MHDNAIRRSSVSVCLGVYATIERENVYMCNNCNKAQHNQSNRTMPPSHRFLFVSLETIQQSMEAIKSNIYLPFLFAR